MSWFARLVPSKIRTDATKKKDIPEGLWSTCAECKNIRYRAELERNLLVCDKCGYHEKITARHRLKVFMDEGAEEVISNYEIRDPLKFKDTQKYKDRLILAKANTGEQEALLVMKGRLNSMPIVSAAFEFDFMGGSMGSIVGDIFVKAVEIALDEKRPFICFTASGGARMQEGVISLFQMAKTTAVLSKLSSRKIPYVTVLTNPTMGGVSASLAMLGDIIVAEPKALIGFTGPRVIEQTVKHSLPEGFQRSEFLLEHGHIDRIVDRRELRTVLFNIISKLIR